MEQLVNKYYSSAKLEEEFGGPIEVLVDSSPHGDIQLIERTASALTRNRYDQKGTLEGLEFEGQYNTMEGTQSLDLEGETPLKMPPVQKSSLQPDERTRVTENNFPHIPSNSRATLASKVTPGFAHPSSMTAGNNLSVVQAAQQSSDEEGSLDITPDQAQAKRQGSNTIQHQDSQKQPGQLGEQVSSFMRVMHST